MSAILSWSQCVKPDWCCVALFLHLPILTSDLCFSFRRGTWPVWQHGQICWVIPTHCHVTGPPYVLPPVCREVRTWRFPTAGESHEKRNPSHLNFNAMMCTFPHWLRCQLAWWLKWCEVQWQRRISSSFAGGYLCVSDFVNDSQVHLLFLS